jgi:putative flavoprotein involved in K+ transport
MKPVQPIATVPETRQRRPLDPKAAQWIEEGTAFTHLAGAIAPATNGGDSPKPAHTERVPVVIIGAGQAGLSVGYHLARRGIRFVILERTARVGDAWRNRWDSLRLFTPAKLDGLDGMRFPANGDTFPTKDAMGDYLESYAKRFSLPVRTGVRVDSVTKVGHGFVVSAGAERWEADQVVIAMSSYQDPFTPAFARELGPDLVQLHSSAYRNPAQMKPGDVLLVGAGNFRLGDRARARAERTRRVDGGTGHGTPAVSH